MYKLCIKLPPFSPDYSGVCSALFPLGGLMVIHDAAGCTGNYTGYDEPRWYGSDSLIYCSGLREIDAVLGDDQKLVDKIAAAAEKLSPRFLTVLGSPVPMVIGTDFEGIAAELEAQTGIPSFGVATTGLNYYDWGAGQAFVALAKRFVRPAEAKIPRGINLLGATPLDFDSNGDIAAMKELLRAAGFQVISDFAMDSTLEDIGRAGEAQVNLVLSSSGMPLARHMEKTHGIPWVGGVPAGKKSLAALMGLLDKTIADRQCRWLGSEGVGGGNILIVHDQLVANSLRACLELDFGLEGIDVATPFHFDKALARPGDRVLPHEGAIKAALNSGYSLVVGDPLLGELFAPSGPRMVDLPQVAVSSKLYWDRIPLISGGNALEALGAVAAHH